MGPEERHSGFVELNDGGKVWAVCVDAPQYRCHTISSRCQAAVVAKPRLRECVPGGPISWCPLAGGSLAGRPGDHSDTSRSAGRIFHCSPRRSPPGKRSTTRPGDRGRLARPPPLASPTNAHTCNAHAFATQNTHSIACSRPCMPMCSHACRRAPLLNNFENMIQTFHETLETPCCRISRCPILNHILRFYNKINSAAFDAFPLSSHLLQKSSLVPRHLAIRPDKRISVHLTNRNT